MKKSNLFGSLFLILVFAVVSSFAQIPVKEVPADYGYVVKMGDQMPAFSTMLINGKSLSNADFKGKVVMLQFTASWCSVCRKEMPFIERDIWQKQKNNKNFIGFLQPQRICKLCSPDVKGIISGTNDQSFVSLGR